MLKRKAKLTKFCCCAFRLLLSVRDTSFRVDI